MSHTIQNKYLKFLHQD